jgi:hypothetical protein
MGFLSWFKFLWDSKTVRRSLSTILILAAVLPKVIEYVDKKHDAAVGEITKLERRMDREIQITNEWRSDLKMTLQDIKKSQGLTEQRIYELWKDQKQAKLWKGDKNASFNGIAARSLQEGP